MAENDLTQDLMLVGGRIGMTSTEKKKEITSTTKFARL